MTARRIRNDLTTTRLLHTLIATRLQPTLDHLQQQLDNIDGYPTTASGRDNGPTTRNTSSSTETAALQRLIERDQHTGGLIRNHTPAAELEYGSDLAHCAHHIAKLLVDWIATNQQKPTEAEKQVHLCKGLGANQKCPRTQIAATERDDGRCLDCGPEWDRRLRERADRARLKYHETRRP